MSETFKNRALFELYFDIFTKSQNDFTDLWMDGVLKFSLYTLFFLQVFWFPPTHQNRTC